MTGIIKLSPQRFPGHGEALIFITFEDTFKKDKNLAQLDDLSYGSLKKKLTREEFEAKDDQMATVENISAYQLIVITGGGKLKDFTHVKLKNLLSQALCAVAAKKFINVNLFYSQNLGKELLEVGQNISLALYLSNYHFDKYKSEEDRKKNLKIRELNLLIEDTIKIKLDDLREGADLGKIIADGICLTRTLVNEPASHLSADSMVKVAREIEKNSNGKITVEVLEEDQCRKLGMGAFLGVAVGSERKPKFIILHYTPPVKSKNKVCLIGKTIIFDSGGLSLKPSEFMEDMKLDMSGGATVLGVFQILSAIPQIPHIPQITGAEIWGILPACENMPSGKALRPGDIVTAINGKTIEVLNTDAEGRLALADGLSYAEKYIKPDITIDIATLTGACMVALGNDITGMFGNDELLMDEFAKYAEKEGDELWKMPLYKPYLKKMKSDIADLKNIGGGRYGGAITAALFLSEFVNKTKWIHLDIAGSAYNNENVKGVITKGGTGWGVATFIKWLMDKS